MDDHVQLVFFIFGDYKAQLSTSVLAPIHAAAVHLSEAWEKTLALVHVSVKHALSQRMPASSRRS